MFTFHDNGSVDMLNHDVRILWPFGNVAYRLPDAEQQSDNQNTEHTDDDLQPLLWRERIKPCPDASRYALFQFNYFLFHFFTVLMSLFSIIVKFRI